MKASTALQIFCMFLLVSSAWSWSWPWEDTSDDFESGKYQKQDRNTKLNMIWKKVTSDTDPAGWPWKISIAGIFVESMNDTFDYVADILPTIRKKLIHSAQGAVVKVQWKSVGDHKYTGIFKGNDAALMRFSIAAERESDSDSNYKVGAGIKHLRNGVKSANWLNMWSLSGQDGANFFKHEFTNHVMFGIDPDKLPGAQKLLVKKFKTASAFPQYTGLSDAATYTKDGTKESAPVFPFQVFLSPTEAVSKMQPDSMSKSDGDAKKHFSMFAAGTHLYDVLAREKPDGDKVKIAEITTASTFTTSEWGDKDLFFQHQRMEDDIKYHPDWKAKCGDIIYNNVPAQPFNGAEASADAKADSSSGPSFTLLGAMVAAGIALVAGIVAGAIYFGRRRESTMTQVYASLESETA